MDKQLFKDKYRTSSIRLPKWDYSQAWGYFVTICVKDMYMKEKKHVLGNVVDDRVVLNDVGKVVEDFWLWIPDHFEHVELDVFVVMPNHVHGILLINEPQPMYKNDALICRDNSWIVSTNQTGDTNQTGNHQIDIHKQQYTRRKMLLPKIIGKFKMQTAKQINIMNGTQWISFRQSNFYEHVIRNDKDLERIQTYIINNPLKWQFDEYNE